MDDVVKAGLKAWNELSRDPDLLPGATMGQFEDLVNAVFTLAVDDSIRRTVPWGLARKMMALAKSWDMEVAAEATQELLKVPMMREKINRLADQI